MSGNNTKAPGFAGGYLLLDDKTDRLIDAEMCRYWWSTLTDEERSAWLKAAQSAEVRDAWAAYNRRMAES